MQCHYSSWKLRSKLSNVTDKEKLVSALKQAGVSESDSNLQACFDEFDKDKSATIDLDEFMQMF